MAKYNSILCAQMGEWVEQNGLMEYGGAPLVSFLDAFHIDQRSYYNWLRDKSDFAETIQKAKDKFRASLATKLVESLAKAAQGYEAETTRTEYVSDKSGKPIISKQIKEKKPVAPNVGAAIFLLTNVAPEWKNRQTSEVTGAEGEPLLSQPITISINEAKPQQEQEKGNEE